MFDKLNFSTLLIDEAAREMRSVNWQSKAQQGVNTKAMTDRFKNNWIFLNMPNFNEFTKSMRQGNIKFRAVIPYRTQHFARVIVQMKSRNWRSDDPWSDEVANKIYGRMEKRYGEISNDLILKIERGLPNTIMDFIIPNLTLPLPIVVEEYERLKIESRKESAIEEKDNSKDKLKKQYNDLRIKLAHVLYDNKLGLGEGKVTKAQFAEAMGCSIGVFNGLLKKNVLDEKVIKKKNFRVLNESHNLLDAVSSNKESKVKPTKESEVLNFIDENSGADMCDGDGLKKAMIESRK